jgi:pimeloyl-ACP methyl ester carboxylesterase
MHADFAEVHWGGRQHRIEYAWIGPPQPARPTLVFLHEGLGSAAIWRGFAQRLCEAAGCRGLVFSRWGYGRSTPRPHREPWPIDYLERQAIEFLPAFFEAVGLDTQAMPPWFYGHSDGGSIALIHAARFPERVGAIAVAAPHIFVEDITVEGIRLTVQAYREGGLKARLARLHDDVESAFGGWSGAWLDPAFRRWNIEALLPRIRCPVLAIQGEGDEYATMAQIDGIAARVPQAQLLKLPDCGHTPHRDQPDTVCAAAAAFFSAAAPAPRTPA